MRGGQIANTPTFGVVSAGVILPLPLPVAPLPFGTRNPDLATAEVIGVYRTILGRAPTSAELSAVAGVIDAGTPIAAVASALLHTTEYESSFVTSDYRVFLGVTPSAADVNAWVTMIQKQGLTAEQVAVDFASTPEFNALHPDNASFIQALYQLGLGRAAAGFEVSAWESVLASGTTRAQAVKDILGSSFADRHQVEGFYSVFLGRPPDPSGLAFWVNAPPRAGCRWRGRRGRLRRRARVRHAGRRGRVP